MISAKVSSSERGPVEEEVMLRRTFHPENIQPGCCDQGERLVSISQGSQSGV